MRRVQMYFDEETDNALTQRALRERVSKAALVRRFVHQCMGTQAGVKQADPMSALRGAFDFEAGDIDDVVYER